MRLKFLRLWIGAILFLIGWTLLAVSGNTDIAYYQLAYVNNLRCRQARIKYLKEKEEREKHESQTKSKINNTIL